jgi:hypothetical protein
MCPKGIIRISSFLYFCIVFSILSLPLRMFLHGITGRDIKIYLLLYLFYVIIAYLGFTWLIISGKLRYIPFVYLMFLLYVIIVTIPISLFNNDPVMVLIGLKQFMPPFVIAILAFTTLKSGDNIAQYLRIITYGGLFAAIFVFFEIFNKFSSVVPFFSEMLLDFAKETGTAQMVRLMSPIESIDNYMRPIGILANYTANGFFIGSAFFVSLICGRRIFAMSYKQKIIPLFLFFGCIATTSKQAIFLVTLLLFGLLLLGVFKKKIFKYYFINSKIKLLLIWKIVFTALSSIYFYNLLSRFILVNIGLSKIGHSVAGGLKNDIELLFSSKLVKIFIETPFSFLFGSGFADGSHQSANLVKYASGFGELHFFRSYFLTLGLVGFLLFFSVLCSTFLSSINGLMRKSSEEKDLYLLSIILLLFLVGNFVHYPPLRLINNFIFAYSLFMGLYGRNKRLKKKR